ncbi:MAG: hypothetical protein CMC70_03040 [Flavobacteriaceae bacterium]|nr:hypothetical protein [Flavobacteriaceae bacterium]|tara:strand:- start:427 stop:1056 length:630 start_codon:yes stop_codon:yes gene_type:complete
MSEIPIYLGDIQVLLALILAVIYFIGFSKYGKAYKIFTLYLAVIAIIQLITFYYALYKWNNIFFFHFYFISQFIFMSLFYYNLLKNNFILLILGLGLVVISAQFVLDPTIFYEYNTYGVSLTQSIIVLYAIIYYYRSLSVANPFMLINTGVLLYFITSILFFASGNLFLHPDIPKETKRYIGLINQFLYFVFQVLIFLEWYRNYRIKKV